MTPYLKFTKKAEANSQVNEVTWTVSTEFQLSKMRINSNRKWQNKGMINNVKYLQIYSY